MAIKKVIYVVTSKGRVFNPNTMKERVKNKSGGLVLSGGRTQHCSKENIANWHSEGPAWVSTHGDICELPVHVFAVAPGVLAKTSPYVVNLKLGLALNLSTGKVSKLSKAKLTMLDKVSGYHIRNVWAIDQAAAGKVKEVLDGNVRPSKKAVAAAKRAKAALKSSRLKTAKKK